MPFPYIISANFGYLYAYLLIKISNFFSSAVATDCLLSIKVVASSIPSLIVGGKLGICLSVSKLTNELLTSNIHTRSAAAVFFNLSNNGSTSSAFNKSSAPALISSYSRLNSALFAGVKSPASSEILSKLSIRFPTPVPRPPTLNR